MIIPLADTLVVLEKGKLKHIYITLIEKQVLKTYTNLS